LSWGNSFWMHYCRENALSGASDAALARVAGCDDRSGHDNDVVLLQSFGGEDMTAQGDERFCLGADDREAGDAVRSVSGVQLQPLQAS